MARYSETYAQDRAEIEDLMARYLLAMDWNDFDSYADCFTEDGTLDYAAGQTVGRENIRAEAKEFKERVAEIFVDIDGNPAILRHVLCHSVIRVEGDKAWHTGLWFETANDGPKVPSKSAPDGMRLSPTMGSFGTYEDELVRVDGEWKFKYRNIRNEFLHGRASRLENPVLEMDRAAEGSRSFSPL